MSDTPLVLLVGHCLPDSMALSRAVARATPGSRVKRVNSERGLDRLAPRASLLLINRALDGRFDAADGIGLIERLVGEDAPAALMLVSNYAEAQARAVSAGASPGIGKWSLGDPETTRRLRAALGREQPASSGGASESFSSGRSP